MPPEVRSICWSFALPIWLSGLVGLMAMVVSLCRMTSQSVLTFVALEVVCCKSGWVDSGSPC